MRRIRLETENLWCRWVLLAVCLVISGAAGADGAGDAAAETSMQARSGVFSGLGELALSRDFPDEAVWLELAGGGQALGLFRPATREPALGALVLLGNVGETAASGLAGVLAGQLAKRGWATMALGLEAPSPSLQRLLGRTPEPVSESDNSAGDTLPVVMEGAKLDDAGQEEAYRERVREILLAALSELTGRGFERPVLLGVGYACDHLAFWPENAGSAQALIWVSPAFYPRTRGGLKAWLEALTGMTILELSATASGNRGYWPGAATYSYQTITITQPPTAADGGMIAGRIHSWLKSR